jgi:hypothetical protein
LSGSSPTSTPPTHASKGDRAAWQEVLDERAELEGTLADGLDEP